MEGGVKKTWQSAAQQQYCHTHLLRRQKGMAGQQTSARKKNEVDNIWLR